MSNDFILYAGIMLFGVFISGVSQVLLKKESQRSHSSFLKEYLNWRVILAYFLFFIATLCTVYAYKVVPLTVGPIIEATSYIYITLFGLTIFKENITKRKWCALAIIIVGIIVCTLSS